MPYQAEISRTNPTAFLFLIDQSGSMEDPWAGSDGGQSKADALATIINRLFTEIVIKCSKDEGVRNYFDVGVLGYGNDVRPALSGPLAGRVFVPVSEIADMPIRVEDRVQKVSDGAGGLVEQSVKFPVWFEPHAKGGTPMTEALRQSREALAGRIQQHPDAFPPIVFNVTDGEATDG
ncbi:MAG: vWA domain-containing protein, partial [Dehalococcoidia bacterium]